MSSQYIPILLATLSDAENSTCGPTNRTGIADLPLLRTLLKIHQKSQKPSLWEVMDSCFSNNATLESSITLLQWFLACLNFTLDLEHLFSWYKRKRWFLWTMTTAKAAENHGDEWGLMWYLRLGIYKSIPTKTHSQNSLPTEALSLEISYHGPSLDWSWRLSQPAAE